MPRSTFPAYLTGLGLSPEMLESWSPDGSVLTARVEGSVDCSKPALVVHGHTGCGSRPTRTTGAALTPSAVSVKDGILCGAKCRYEEHGRDDAHRARGHPGCQAAIL
jgi:hypothetical protein